MLSLAAQAQVHHTVLERRGSINLDAIAREDRAPLSFSSMPRPMSAWDAHFDSRGEFPDSRVFSSPRGAKSSVTGFAGILDNYVTTPPDCAGAAGPNEIVTMLNSGVLIQDRAGHPLPNFPVTLAQFWSGLGQFSKIYDPRIQFDAASGRWIAAGGANPWSADSVLLLGVSETSDPSGKWDLYAIPTGTEGFWGDYPQLGFNQTWIILTANLYTLPPAGGYTSTRIYAFDKTALYGRGKATYSFFNSDSGALTPATDLDNSRADVFYFARTVSGAASGRVRLSVLNGPAGRETFTSTAADLAMGDTWADGPAEMDFAPQAGSWLKVDTGDSRLQNCVMRGGSVWCVHTVFLPAAKPTRSSVEWFQADTASARLIQRGRVDDPSGATFYADPSISVNRNFDVLIGYSRFSLQSYPSAGYSFRGGADPLNSIQPGVIFKPGEAPYVGPNSDEGANRWGDVSTTMVDPLDDLSFWTIQEFAATPTNYFPGRWGTWWGKVAVGAPVAGTSRN
jgi:hypothetical protein